MAASLEQIRLVASSLPRTSEGLVAERVKFRIGPIVYVSVSADESLMGFGFPKEQRDALVAGDPEKFLLPRASDLRYNWAVVRLAMIDKFEMAELVLDAWCVVVSKKTSAPFLAALPARWPYTVFDSE